MEFDCRKIRQGFHSYYPSTVSGVTELEVIFNHTFDYVLQMHQVSGTCTHYWGRPSCFPRKCIILWGTLRTEKFVSMAAALKGAKKLRVTTTFRRRQTLRSALPS
jgi:hypothetical protein